ncbi:MAG TPA: glutamine-synthetase adenylyltransferase, partial [Maritimibacter sp.]|nr:glutamine-synthetase adenylyltransferase [Maritimibacter sp.]
MSFARHITRTPRPYDPDPAREIADRYDDLAPELRAVLVGAGGCSPYLKDLMEREEDWLREVLEEEPGVAFASALDLGEASLDVALRRAKRRVALFTGIADLAGVWSLEEVTHALTVFGDFATQKALEHEVGVEIKRGKLPGGDHGDLTQAGGAVAIAMGKMGAFELNYSSDIDLIMLFDDERYEPEDFHEAR